MQGSVSASVREKNIDDVEAITRSPLALALTLLNPNQCSNRAGFEYFLGH